MEAFLSLVFSLLMTNLLFRWWFFFILSLAVLTCVLSHCSSLSGSLLRFLVVISISKDTFPVKTE